MPSKSKEHTASGKNFFWGDDRFEMKPTVIAILAAAILAVLTSGCERDMTLERERAAAVFERAKDAILRNDHRDTRRFLLEVARLDDQLGNRTRLAETLVLLSENYAAGGRFDSAAMLAHEAQRLYANLGDKPGIRTAVLARARVHELCDELENAYALLVGALQVEEALGNRYAAQELKWRIIPVARKAGNPEAERRYLRQLIAEYDASGEKGKQAHAVYELGASYLSRNQLQSAQKYLGEARTLALAGSDSLLLISVMQMQGLAARRESDMPRALRHYSEGLRLSDVTHGAHRLREELLLRTGNLLLHQRRFTDAVRYFNVALRSAIHTQHRLVEAYALLQLGHCSLGLNSDGTAQEYESGAELMAHIGIPSSNAYAAACLGQHALATGQPSRALEYFRQAVDAHDSAVTAWDPLDVFAECEDVLFGAGKSTPHDDLIEMYLRLGKPEEAFLAMERKSRTHLLANISRLRIETRSMSATNGMALHRKLLGMYGGVERQLAVAFSERAESIPLTTELRQSLRVMRQRLRDKGDSLVVTQKMFREILSPSHPTLAEIQQRIPVDAVLLAYHPAPRSLHIFTVSRNGFSSEIGAVGREQLRRIIDSHLSHLQRLSNHDAEPTQKDKGEITERSIRLYGAMVFPAEAQIREAGRLIVMLPSDMPLTPLHSLQRDRLSGPLMGKYAVRYISDAGMLAALGSRVSASPTGVAFGNRGATDWDVEYELSDVRIFLKDARVLVDNTGTIDALRRAGGDVLHASIDVRSDWSRPDRSYFILVAGPGYESRQYHRFGEFFSVAPFSNIILSNLAEVQLHSIVPRIFHINGTTDIVLNCFVPSRKAKKQFVELYYSLLLSGNSIEQSCRQAALMMRERPESADPHAWGAFMVW